MQITTKTEYAIRALTELGTAGSDAPLSMREICQRQNLPQKYIEQLFTRLRRNKIIKSVHGAAGGYVLADDPENITLHSIMDAVEEYCHTVKCEKPNSQPPAYCQGTPCAFYGFWKEVTDHLTNYFSSLTLAHILQKIQINNQG